jgi:hypothetical protein
MWCNQRTGRQAPPCNCSRTRSRVYVCMCACVHVCMCMCVFVCMYVCVCACARARCWCALFLAFFARATPPRSNDRCPCNTSLQWLLVQRLLAAATGVRAEQRADVQGRDADALTSGGKRPRSSMSPTLVLDQSSKPFLAIGSPGGGRITFTVLGALIAVLDMRMSLKVSRPPPCKPETRNP